MLVPPPPGASAVDLASASDNIPDAWRTVGPHLRQQPGAPVLVVGGAAASIGLYAAAIAVAAGSERVDYLDRDPERLALAATLGANPLAFPRRASGGAPLPRGYPITVDASSHVGGLDLALRWLAPGGVCTSVGYYLRRGTPLPLWRMYLAGTRLHVGLSNPPTDLPDVLALVAGGVFRPGRVSTLIAAWNDAPEALLDRQAIKVVVARPEVLAGPRPAVRVAQPAHQGKGR